jgi:DNA-binding MarR family transcriptional regulator
MRSAFAARQWSRRDSGTARAGLHRARESGGRLRFVFETKRWRAVELSPKQALELWRAASVAALRRSHPDLTARQFALLLQVYLTPPPHTLRGLARELAMSKPAVSRALDTLGRRELLRRKTDAADRRSLLVQRTVKGSVYLREFGDLAAKAAKGL